MEAWKETVKKEVLIPIGGVKHICIGDNLYLEEIARGEASKGAKDAVLDETFGNLRHGMMLVQEVEAEYQGDTIQVTRVRAAYSSYADKGKAFDDFATYLSGNYYEEGLKKAKELGCDTASFEVSIDDRTDTISTGADGLYGYALVMKQYYGLSLGFEIDSLFLPFDEAVREFSYLFRADKDKFDEKELADLAERIANTEEEMER